MTVAVDVGDPPQVALVAYRSRAADFASDVLDVCRRSRTTRIDIGDVDPDADEIRAMLGELAQHRRENGYGLDLSCRITPATDRANLPFLRATGVRRVEIDATPSSGELSARGLDGALLRRIALVTALEQQEIAVTWQAPVADAADGEAIAAASMCTRLHHVTPPAETPTHVRDSACGRILAYALDEWRRHHEPNTLTYSRGPGFVRIYDRRAPSSTVTFTTLVGAQADVFLAASSSATIEELVGVAKDVPVARVERFLAKLVQRGILCRTTRGLYQSLPTRRAFEERWGAWGGN